jgi:hypothetical protein
VSRTFRGFIHFSSQKGEKVRKRVGLFGVTLLLLLLAVACWSNTVLAVQPARDVTTITSDLPPPSDFVATSNLESSTNAAANLAVTVMSTNVGHPLSMMNEEGGLRPTIITRQIRPEPERRLVPFAAVLKVSSSNDFSFETNAYVTAGSTRSGPELETVAPLATIVVSATAAMDVWSDLDIESYYISMNALMADSQIRSNTTETRSGSPPGASYTDDHFGLMMNLMDISGPEPPVAIMQGELVPAAWHANIGFHVTTDEGMVTHMAQIDDDENIPVSICWDVSRDVNGIKIW